MDPADFSLDIDAIARAITPRTRVVIVNSPSNATGRVLPKQTWDALASVLEHASRTHGRRIWLLSDEPYRRIRCDGIGFASPVGSYPWTMIDYSYGKVLLAPGQRLGYLALSPLLGIRARRAAHRVHTDPARDRLGVPQRPHAAQCPRAGECEHRHGGAHPQARPAVRRPQRGRMHPHAAGGHLLSVGTRAGR